MKTEDPVFSKVIFSFSSWLPLRVNIEIQTWAVN